MARCAHDLRRGRALDVNENRTRMHNRAIVYICARVCYTYVRVHGAALRMCLVRPGWGGDTFIEVRVQARRVKLRPLA